MEAEYEDEDASNIAGKSQLIETGHVSLFSTIDPCTIEFLESKFSHDDSAFRDFRKRLSKALSSMLGVRINLNIHDEVIFFLAFKHDFLLFQ